MEIKETCSHLVQGVPLTNKTWKYLYPSLKGWGEDFTRMINTCNKVEVGIQDHLSVRDIRENKEGKLFISFRPDLFSQVFYNECLPYFRGHESYIGDYAVHSETKDHIIVFKIPDRFQESYKNFLQGKYSLMYSNDEILELYSSKVFLDYTEVLSKTKKGKENFIKFLNEEFNTSLGSLEVQEGEYDLPPETDKEIFNNISKNKFIKYNPKENI